jgi:hypothetical protein
MKDQSRISSPQTLTDSPVAISSPESPDGNSPLTSRPGQVEMFGPVPVPVSPSVPQASVKRMKTADISGRRGSTLSEFADRQSSLASRLMRQLEWAGSIEYSMAWRRKATPAGRLYYQLAASGHRTSERDYSGVQTDGWLTLRANDPCETPEQFSRRMGDRSLNKAGSLAGQAVYLSGWYTPKSTDGSKGGPNQSGGSLPNDASKAGWPTPGIDSFRTRGGDRKDEPGLDRQAKMAGWATPQFADGRGATGPASRNKDLGRDALLTHGLNQSGSHAVMGSGGVLNPAFVLWLMGFPDVWESCVPQGMRSFRKSPRNS